MDVPTFWGLLDQLDWRHEGDDDRVRHDGRVAKPRYPLAQVAAQRGPGGVVAAHAMDTAAWRRR